MRAHFILYVQSPAVSRNFYRNVLGCAPTLDVPGMTEFELRPDVVLGLMPEAGITHLLGPEIDPSQLRRAGRAEVYLVVDDPAAYHARSLAAGADELSALKARDWGHVAAYSRDPDGYVIAFAAPAGGCLPMIPPSAGDETAS